MSVDYNDGGYDPGSTSRFIDPASDPNTNPNDVGDANSPFKRGDVFVNQTTLDPSAGIAGLKKFVTDNKAFITGAGALASAYSGGSGADKKVGYQGVIPSLSASRSMIAAPPTLKQGYRPGAGGIDYGGDVTYALAPGQNPFANLSGTSGSAAGANLSGTTTVPGGTKTDTITGGTKTDTITGGTGNDTITGGTKTDTITKNLGSKGYQAAIAAGLTPAQYLNNINQYLIDNPRASKSEIDAIMAKFGVSQEDLQEALRTSTFSDYTKYGLTHGMGLQELNFAISNFVEKNPYATNKQIQDAMKAAGVNDADIARGLNALSASAGKEAAVIGGMGLDQLYKNILDYQSKPRTSEEINAALAATGLEQRDLNAAQRYAKEKGYVGNPKSEAAAFDYLGSSNVVETPVTKVVETPVTKVADVIKEEATPPPAAQNNVASDSGKLSEIYQYFADPSTQAALASGNTRGIAETMQALGYSPAEVAQATGANVADLQAAYDAALGIGQQDSYLDAATSGYLGYAEGGEIAMAKGRYLQGGTDGMADEIPAQIGKDQPAALSHGEFVIPADVVSHMGNGNSDAGAKKLYKMMDKIRMARTGNKKQGKKINPDKFMPGGLASSKYVTGGSVKHFQTGGSTIPTGVSGVESNLSNFAGPYVTNMLGQGQAISNMPYQAYLGQLTAGESPLQTGAFNTAAGLTTPKTVGDAAKTAGDIATKTGALSYSPTAFTNQFTAPTTSQATNFTNQYTVPKAYSPTTSSFDAAQAATYMNPYLKASLDPQLDEARRQSEITQNQNNAQMTRAGAYGGGRQAILNAETQRNLGTNLANITSQGYNAAFNNAQQQFNTDQARKMQEAQFGAQQGMSAAQLQAQFGLSAQQANEAARQFGAQQGMSAAQFGAQYGLAGQQAAEQSKQFGQNFGLQGLQTGLQAAQTQGALGGQQNQIGLANLAQQLAAGQQQRGIESEGIAADKAQFEEARANPYKMIQFQQSLLQGLPLAAQSYQGIEPSALLKASQGATTVNQLLKNLGLV